MAFAKEGAKVCLPDIASADHVVKAIQDMGGTAIGVKCDVTDEQRSIKRSQVEGDLVGTVLFLSSPESDFMTGQLLNVDGGFHFVG
jgi:NAD(P)-dependent dehydrogenase (short-subunit alcohol dehydrogenase family)